MTKPVLIILSVCMVMALGMGIYQVLIIPYRRKVAYYRWLKTPYINNYYTTLKTLYKDTDGYAIAKNHFYQLKRPDNSYIYGEINILSFPGLLSLVNPQENDVFYDLGSGTGKAVFAAALLYNFKKCCGIEKVKALHQEAHRLLVTFKNLINKPYYANQNFNIEFINEDMRKYDFSDATIIFINGTCFDYYFWEKLTSRLENLPIGSRLIVTTKIISSKCYVLQTEYHRLMSWGMAKVSIYKKII